MRWSEIWSAVRGDGRSAELEREVLRLRAENRALMNSILGIAGVPPVIVAEASESDALRLGLKVGAPEGSVAAGAGTGVRRSLSDAGGKKGGVAPLRRRSWHQVYRMLEIDAARRKDRVDGGGEIAGVVVREK